MKGSIQDMTMSTTM
jgi:hypothetical protein